MDRIRNALEHGVLDNELEDIRRCFESTLRPKELAVFRLRQNSGFKEIGEELGIKPNTAKAQCQRVVTRFKAWLEKRYPDIYHFLRGGGE